MLFLLAACVVWALSFGLIKEHLTGLDPLAVAMIRLFISAAAFSPWVLRRRVSRNIAGRAAGLGVVQFGLMYVFYIASYQYLPAYLVALYTIFTPLYVVLIDDALSRRFRPRHMFAALLAVLGAGFVNAVSSEGGETWRGIVLLQAANLCFATGQLAYRRLSARADGVPATCLTGWMFCGAFVAVTLASLVAGNGLGAELDRPKVLVLAYLGLVPTGLGFYLWNRGAVLTSAGLLAVANNLKIPLAVLCAWLLFGETTDYERVGIGLSILVLALFVAGTGSSDRSAR